MTPAARIAAATTILDEVIAGRPAEQVLTHWARANRYAGSGDRAAIRDHVFTALRCRRSYGWLGGADSGRGLMIGALKAADIRPETVFTGDGYAPPPLTATEAAYEPAEAMPQAVRLDCPDWLMPLFHDSLGSAADAVLAALRTRAPVFLRVNSRRTSLGAAMVELEQAGIATRPHPLSATALEVTGNPRRVQSSPAYLDGRVEFQDAASQAAMDLIVVRNNMKLLDYCAGGGGKSLALMARADLLVTAHDIDGQRMRDLPARADRAGVRIERADRSELIARGYDIVLCDAPCTGSGAWRRAPEAKWRLAPERLAELTATQAAILDEAVEYVADGGALVYVTCSLFTTENEAQVACFLDRHPDWRLREERRFTPLEGGDGFYFARLTREPRQV